MRKLSILAFAGVCVFCQGCGLGLQATRVLTYRTAEAIEDHKERKRNRDWAEATWNRLSPTVGQLGCSPDYADGFKEGFAEYLFQGGQCHAPSLPPLHYRKIKYQTPEGYRAIELWYAGYQHGASVADEGGFRRLVTGPPPPSSVPLFTEPVVPAVPPMPALPPVMPHAESPPPLNVPVVSEPVAPTLPRVMPYGEPPLPVLPQSPVRHDEPPLPVLPQPPVRRDEPALPALPAVKPRDEPPLPALPQPPEQRPSRRSPLTPGPHSTTVPVWHVEQTWQIGLPSASGGEQMYHTLTRWLPWPAKRTK
jgi:hypothetical protein